jgi:hypothetical protein
LMFQELARRCAQTLLNASHQGRLSLIDYSARMNAPLFAGNPCPFGGIRPPHEASTTRPSPMKQPRFAFFSLGFVPSQTHERRVGRGQAHHQSMCPGNTHAQCCRPTGARSADPAHGAPGPQGHKPPPGSGALLWRCRFCTEALCQANAPI